MATDHSYTGDILKPRQWAITPAANVPIVTLPDATVAEAIAALAYGWDSTDSIFVKVPVDHTTGALKVSAVVTSGGGTTPSGTATLSNVSGSASSVTVLAANTSRLGVVIVNDSTADLYIKFGTTASTSSFTYHLYPGQTFSDAGGYTGRIDGIWSAANGAARVTELTA